MPAGAHAPPPPMVSPGAVRSSPSDATDDIVNEIVLCTLRRPTTCRSFRTDVKFCHWLQSVCMTLMLYQQRDVQRSGLVTENAAVNIICVIRSMPSPITVARRQWSGA